MHVGIERILKKCFCYLEGVLWSSAIIPINLSLDTSCNICPSRSSLPPLEIGWELNHMVGYTQITGLINLQKFSKVSIFESFG